jgi:hypothetical protein
MNSYQYCCILGAFFVAINILFVCLFNIFYPTKRHSSGSFTLDLDADPDLDRHQNDGSSTLVTFTLRTYQLIFISRFVGLFSGFGFFLTCVSLLTGF